MEQQIITQSRRREMAVEAKVEEVYRLADKVFGKQLKRPKRVTFDLRGRTAGMAHYGYEWKLRFNMELMAENEQDFLASTVGHEVAHLVAYEIYNDNCGHDVRWITVMVKLGLEPTRCHSYSTANTALKSKRAKLESML